MKQKTKFQLAAVAFLLALCPTAVNAQQMVVKTQQGNDVYNLPDIIKILVKEEGMSVEEKAKEGKNYNYPQILKITFNTATSVASLKADPSNFKAKLEDDGNVISWTGTNGEQEVTLLDITGKMIRHARQSSQRMDISALPHGTYILKVGKNNIKFAK